MKNRFFVLLAALSFFAVGCEGDKNVGNPDQVIANTIDVHSPGPEGFFVDAEIYGTGVTERGVVYGRTMFPIVGDEMVSDPDTGYAKDSGSGAGRFSLEVTGLKPGADYYARPYAKSGGKVAYGSSMMIRTRPNPFFEALAAMGLAYGTVRKADKTLAMHYTFDQENNRVTLTYIEPDGDRDARHVTMPVSFDEEYTACSWSEVTNDGAAVSGLALEGTGAVSVSGSEGLVVDEPFSEDEIWGMYTHRDFGGISRLSELHDNHVSIDPIWGFPTILGGIELSGELTGVVGLPGSGEYKGYLYRMNTRNSDNRPVIPQTEDRISFSKGGIYTGFGWAMTNEADIANMETALAAFYDFWYHADGIIMVRATDDGKQVFGGEGTGDIYYYGISATGKGWVYLRLRGYGQ